MQDVSNRIKGASRLTPRAAEHLNDRNGPLPIWVRAPTAGPEYYTGFTRPKLYELIALGHIKSVSIREPGQVKGVRLFNLQSILDFVDRQCAAAVTESHKQPAQSTEAA